MKKIIWVGDSTVAFNQIASYPQTGIGQEFGRYIKRDWVVLDYAKNGESSKSFYDGGLFEPAKEVMEEGDLLLIEFGHNDEKPDERRRTEPRSSYQEYLMEYIRAAREKKAQPVLITPLSRRLFGEDGKIENSHGDYPAAVIELGEREGVPVVDLTERSRVLYETAGDEASRKWFVYDHKKNRQDNTHLHYEGAVRMAGLVADGFRDLGGIYKDILA